MRAPETKMEVDMVREGLGRNCLVTKFGGVVMKIPILLEGYHGWLNKGP